MWGGTPDRNMVSNMKGLPLEWDVKTKKNVKWVAELGSQSYGNPVVAGGMVFVGTNNELVRDKNQGGDRGVLMAFDEKTGEFHVAADAPEARIGPRQRLAVSGRRLVAAGRRRAALLRHQPRRADVSRHPRLPRQRERRSVQGREAHRPVRRRHHLAARHDGGGRHLSAQPGQLLTGDLRRSDLRQHLERPGREPRQHPVAAGPVDHRGQQEHRQSWCGKTTRCTTTSCTASGRRPSVGTIGGVLQVVSAQGDGWVRGYEAQTGKKLWEFDTNPKDAVWPRTRNELISTPVIHENVVYIGERTGPGARRRRRALLRHRCRPSAATSPSPGCIWQFDKIRRSISTPAVADGLVYIADFSGYPALPRRQDRTGVLDARHAGRRLGRHRSSSTGASISATRTATSS